MKGLYNINCFLPFTIHSHHPHLISTKQLLSLSLTQRLIHNHYSSATQATMHATQTLLTSALLLTSAIASPLAAAKRTAGIDYTPPGGWESVDYPDDAGKNLDYYPPPPGGWENVKYPPGTGANGGSCDPPFKFTSTYHVVATGSEVRNGTTPAPGPKDAVGFFEYGINAPQDTICFVSLLPPINHRSNINVLQNITLLNVAGTPQSPARTATHIHQAARGASGPPRLSFPNPEGDDKKRNSVGCLKGPFTTGLNGPDGKDTGTGFKVAQIEKDPAAFFTDFHSNLFSLGVVRGQLA